MNDLIDNNAIGPNCFHNCCCKCSQVLKKKLISMCKNLLEETTQRNLRQKRNSFIRELDQLLDLFPKNFLFSEFLR